ncbi:MAG: tRNA uridine-5-carboxymethylaminomethyl(34) synthesis GTPase MnmE [Ruminococcaceae bacterium]|nr:tRNA uridine-5-carboxymethylaminomethyl(34) synthesis GTPase MnmE [Oscillospiraceae bacterium]
MDFYSTVAAISTPQYPGGIAVIRISGEDAFDIADKVFKSVSGVPLSNCDGYTVHFGHAYISNSISDTVLATVFRAPKSYTGENVVELSCHGGVYLSKQLLQALYEAGATPAENGEFTKRAFLNGKLDLTEAEAVMDMISAESNTALAMASKQLSGALSEKISSAKGAIVSVLAEITAFVDFPDEDAVTLTAESLIDELTQVEKILSKLISTFDDGAVLRNGVNTVLCGKPNVGKSTLMNLLSGSEKSIVTDIPGTTRDIVEETVRVGEILLKLADTAGIRDTDDTVEAIGVKRAVDRISDARLVIGIFDSSRPADVNDKMLIDAVKKSGGSSIAVLNKTDLPTELDSEFILGAFDRIVYLSAINGSGIDELASAVNELMLTDTSNVGEAAISARHLSLVKKAHTHTQYAKQALESGMPLDMSTSDLSLAADALAEITGELITEEILDEVFSKFCVGK